MLLHASAALLLVLSAPKRAPPAPLLDTGAVLAELEQMALKDLWPGFDPRSVPLAVYDGKRTLLVHHPKQPAGFTPVPEIAGALEFPGRHSSIRANSSTELDGVLTATVALDTAHGVTVPKAAALLIHESFHVFQRTRHPTWSANEADLFTYPFEDDAVLTLRRVETRALVRALGAQDPKGILCWSLTALETRRKRFDKMPATAVAYEHGNELNEGLAAYVEGRALEKPERFLPEKDFPADAIRERGYASGRALAVLLDRTDEDWRETLEKNKEEALDLDELLRRALALKKGKACAISDRDRDAMARASEKDVEALGQKKAKDRAHFMTRPGWKLIVEAKDQPLAAGGFDPLNVEVLGKTEVLHGRWIKLTSALGNVEVLDRPSLTEAAGDHPLFRGVRRVTVTGLPSEPVIKKSFDGMTLTAPGVQGQLNKDAKVSKSAKEVRVILEVPR